MRKFMAGSCLVPCMTAALPFAAQAQTSISTSRTTPVVTSTVNDGAADDVGITSAGSIDLDSGVAVTVDSDNDVANAGAITISDADGAIGIQLAAGMSSVVDNSRTITLDEDYTAEDSDDDDDDDGAFALGSGRFGISAQGALTGSIDNSGTITVEGNDSGGIYLDGTLTGSLTSSGTITVTGDGSYGVRTADVAGNVTLEGTITTVGAGSVGYAADGDIDGALVLQGTITSTGYRYTTPPVVTSTLDEDDLLQGGGAARVSGNVSGGILVAAPPEDNDDSNDDEDGDGVDDADEGTGTLTSYGAAPGLLVGSGSDIVIGAVAGDADGNGLVIDGNVYGYGVYDGIDGTGVRIGGEGGTVAIAGGISISGYVAANSISDATGLAIADGATVPSLTLSGTIGAVGGGGDGETTRAIGISAGGSLTTITSSGAITATASGTGVAYGIQDLSGTLTTITNSGSISAAADLTANAIAIDVSTTATGVTVLQEQVDTDVTPTITGNLLFGAGNDRLIASAGRISGDIDFGAGSDTLALSGTAKLTGDIDFGGDADVMTLSDSASYSGTISNSTGLALTVAGGSFVATNTGSIALSSLDVGAAGTIGVSIDGSRTSSLYAVSGAASFATGSTADVTLSGVLPSEGSHVIVTAGSLSGTLTAALPYLFDGTVTNSGSGLLTLEIARKTATELGLNRWEGAAYDSILSVADSDSDVASVLLDKTDASSLKSVFRQMLPDHAGGTFEAVTAGSRASMRFLEDRGLDTGEDDGLRLLFQQVGWGSSKGTGQTASYDVIGWGVLGGAEISTGIGRVGGTLSYLIGRNSSGDNENDVIADTFEASLFWRLRSGGLNAYARGSIGQVSFASSRFLYDSYDSITVERTSKASWGGTLLSASAGASYEFRAGRFSVRPIGSLEYYRLSEDARTETGGGTAFDLSIGARKSDELAGVTTLAISFDLKKPDSDTGYLRLEGEAGRRTIFGGAIADTTASFGSGAAFTLESEARTDGWLGRMRLTGGNDAFGISGEAAAEQQQGALAVSLRATLRSAF